jgi:hypothetical protein
MPNVANVNTPEAMLRGSAILTSQSIREVASIERYRGNSNVSMGLLRSYAVLNPTLLRPTRTEGYSVPVAPTLYLRRLDNNNTQHAMILLIGRYQRCNSSPEIVTA